jgi:thiamine biosynthesis lipoprotein
MACQVCGQEMIRIERSHHQMGTLFRIVAYAVDTSLAYEAIDSAFSRLDGLNDIFSDYKEDSELSKLGMNAVVGNPIGVSSDLFRVLRTSEEISRLSDGVFDITIGPLTRLWRHAFKTGIFPREEDVSEAKNRVNYMSIQLNEPGNFVTLTEPALLLDVGGIAKGYAVDCMYRVLKDYGFPVALIDGGGDIYAGDSPPGKEGWKLRFFAAGESQEIKSVIISNRAAATSGDVYNYMEHKGHRYSHIIDPRTGYGIQDGPIVTVLANTCMTADALASVFSIISPDEAPAIERAFPEAEVFLQYKAEIRQ